MEKAYEFHKNEEKLLNEINQELKEYWNISDMTHKTVQEKQDVASNNAVSSKMTHKLESKVKAKAKTETKEAPKSTAVVEEKTEDSKPNDSVNTEVEENV